MIVPACEDNGPFQRWKAFTTSSASYPPASCQVWTFSRLMILVLITGMANSYSLILMQTKLQVASSSTPNDLWKSFNQSENMLIILEGGLNCFVSFRQLTFLFKKQKQQQQQQQQSKQDLTLWPVLASNSLCSGAVLFLQPPQCWNCSWEPPFLEQVFEMSVGRQVWGAENNLVALVLSFHFYVASRVELRSPGSFIR